MEMKIKQSYTNQEYVKDETSFSKDVIQQELSKLGLDGLIFDYASFPIISLKGNSFEMKADPDYHPNHFTVTVMRTIEKYVLTDIKDNNYQEIKYSADGITTSQGESIKDCVAQMTEQGRTPVIKRYLDVLAQLHSQDKYNNQLVVFSISPTSVSRVSGFFMQLKLQGKINQLQQLKICISKGETKTSKGGHNYRLWHFELAKEQSHQVA